MAYGAITVPATAGGIAVPYAGYFVTVSNLGTVNVYRGDDDQVTVATGTPIRPEGSYTFKRAAYLIAESGTVNCRYITESADTLV